MSKRPSLTRQIQTELETRLCIGESKHEAKKQGVAHEGIYSWGTFNSYMKHCNYFTAYCKAEHGCRTLDECRQYVDEWLKSRSELSAYTQKLEASALAKLYGCSTRDFVKTATRNRDEITRSRGEKTRDAHFSEEKNRDFVDFCRGTGLRRQELEQLKGTALIYRDGKPHLRVTDGTKGGRARICPVTGEVAKIEVMMQAAGSGKVFDKIPNGADVHSYRADYATAVYKANARDLETCKASPFWNPEHSNGKGKPKGGYDRDSVYHMRGTHKGEWLDKQAMKIASEALGHNRISVVGEHYIRG